MRLLPVLFLGGFILSAAHAHAQTGSISGSVTDAVTLAAVGDTTILVNAFDLSGQSVRGTALDAAGHYELAPLGPGSYFVRVTNTGATYVQQLHQNISCVAADCPVTSGTPVVVGSSGAVTVDFALQRAGALHGTVRRASDASPINRVGVHLYNGSGSPVASTQTSSTGQYGFTGLAAGTYLVRTAQALSFGFNAIAEVYDGVPCPSQFPVSDCRIVSGTPIVVAAGATVSGIDFSLDPSGTISGTVVAEGSSSPLAGVVLWAYKGDVQVAGGFTNASGEYSISGLPPGSYRVRTGFNLAASTVVVMPAGGSVTGINFSLPQGGSIAGTITGQLSLPTDWLLPPEIYAYSASGVLVQATNLGLPGAIQQNSPIVHYQIANLPPGQYYLVARDPNVAAFGTRPNGGDFVDELYGDIPCVTIDCDVRRGVPVTVTAGNTTSGVDFTVTKGASSTLMPAAPPELRLFDSRGVELVNVVRQSLLGSQTLIGIPPGTYYARFGNRLHGGAECVDCPPTSGRPIVIRPGDFGFTLDFGTAATGVAVSGTVTDIVGATPLSTVTVELVTDAGVAAGAASTDFLGRYVINGVLPGTYFLRTHNDRGYVDKIFPDVVCASCDVHAGAPIVVAAVNRTGLDFSLAAGGIVSGAVSDSAGVGVGGVPVSLFTPSGSLAGRVRASTVGSYRLTLPAGTYRARADATASHGAEIFSERPCTSANCDVTAGTPIAVTTGTISPNINFTLASCSPITISPSALASAVVGRAYRQVLSVTGGTGPSAFQITSGSLPQGIALSSSTGVLAGTPTVTARHEFTVSTSDANGCGTARTYTLDVQACAFTLSPSSATVPAAGGSVTVTIGDACGSEQVFVLSEQVPTPIPFVHVQPGPAGQVSFTVDPNTSAAPRVAPVTIGRRVFEIRQAGVGSLPPFGSLDLPGDGWQVSGAVAVGGWALDDLQVARVLIYRDSESPEPPGIVFLGTAVFVPGARPDVEQAFPTTPLNHRAGFGFMILTNGLPNQGTGGFRIHAIAQDVEGHQTLLGSRTLFGLNASAAEPFGTIDTPGQGETIAGQNYLNWGWALTPQPGMIPTDGSTIQVIIDGAPVGNVNYNLFRPDVSGSFPGLANTPGPVGYRAIDTTALAEGLHTLSWTVTNTLGLTSGLGSRFFTVANSADAQLPAQSGLSTESESTARVAARTAPPAAAEEAPATPIGVPAAPHSGRREASVDSSPLSDADVTVTRNVGVRRPLRAGRNGMRSLTLESTERLELALTAAAESNQKRCDGTWAGYLVKNGELVDLPVGSSLDPSGTFYWLPGPGFAGRFAFLFIRTGCDGKDERLPVVITIKN